MWRTTMFAGGLFVLLGGVAAADQPPPQCCWAFPGKSRVPAMKRTIGDFDVTWALDLVLVTARGRAEHYDFRVSADRKQIECRYSSSRPDIPPGDALAETARKAAVEFLRLEQGDEGPPLWLLE
jgi:hypothetical protein